MNPLSSHFERLPALLFGVRGVEMAVVLEEREEETERKRQAYLVVKNRATAEEIEIPISEETYQKMDEVFESWSLKVMYRR